MKGPAVWVSTFNEPNGTSSKLLIVMLFELFFFFFLVWPGFLSEKAVKRLTEFATNRSA
jgi:hypothetical protein